ncbi:MAG: hypothetical protein WC378_16750 [Opitutaceae bacterium]|jgi:hypothetical protein
MGEVQGAGLQERRTPQRSATTARNPAQAGGAMAAASVEAFPLVGRVGGRAQRSPEPSDGERAGTASAGPCGPGRRERSDRSRRPSEASGHADPRRGRAVKRGLLTARLRASPAACRAQRGPRRALPGGRRREEADRREATERRATARILQERRFRPDSGSGLAAQAGLLSTGPERLQERREEADGVSAPLARRVPPVSLRFL